ncbi:hypothetical protein FRC17_011152 [Serendipita sp. 399]|nr:hypothetical protein FRC17_011152 [Serendipita sp. 399]
MAASSRVPVEVWWKIFQDVFSLEGLFATTYNGDDWPQTAAKLRYTYTSDFKAAEEQRKVLRSVCKVWRRLADSEGRRFVPVDLFGHAGSSAVTDRDSILTTWGLYCASVDILSQDLSRVTAQWRVLRICQESAKGLEHVHHPHLRRLEMFLGRDDGVPYVPDDLVDALKSFTNITWVRYMTYTTGYRDVCLNDDEGERVTLPNLQVLYYYGTRSLHLPFYRLVLPSLRHLTIITRISAEIFPLRRIIAAYGETLHSLQIQASARSNGPPVPDDLFPLDDPGYFPHWNYVPHLRNLWIGESMILKYHLIPSNHPLRVFTAQMSEMDDLCSWIELARNLKRVGMLLTVRDESNGGLVGAYNGLSILSCDDLKALEAKVASRGIVLEVFKSSRNIA